MKKVLILLIFLSYNLIYAEQSFIIAYRNFNNYKDAYYTNIKDNKIVLITGVQKYTSNIEKVNEIFPILGKTYYSNVSIFGINFVCDKNHPIKIISKDQFINSLMENDELLKEFINIEYLNKNNLLENYEGYVYNEDNEIVGLYSGENIICPKNSNNLYYENGEKIFLSNSIDKNGNTIFKILDSPVSKHLIFNFAEQLKVLFNNNEIRLFAAVMVVVGGFVVFRMVKHGLNWLKMEPYYSDLDKAFEAYKKGEVGDSTLNKALGRDYKRYKMKNSQWHYGKNGRVVFDNTDGVMSFREFSKNRLKDRWKYKNQYDVKKNEGFKKYVDKKQKIEDLEFKRLPDEQLSSEDYRKKYEKEINGFLLHHMNNYRSYDETFLRKEYMEKGIYNEETEAEIQNMLNIIEEENRKSDQEFFDKQEQIYNESPIDSMEWHYPISEA